MPGIFDTKFFNAEVFGKYLETVPRYKQNAFLKSGVLRTRNDLRTMLDDQTGGNFISIPMVGRIGGDPVNYDGSTNITATSIGTYIQSMIVTGRAKAWTEKDFSYDITGGHDFMADIARQVSEYWDDIDQGLILSVLKGIFGVSTNNFNTDHTLDISAESSTGAYVGATTLNNALQKAVGANKNLFAMAIMNSQVQTNMENLDLLEFIKGVDADGMQKDTTLTTWNGRSVLVDDEGTVEHGYDSATSSTPGALKVVASSATTGQINLADVQAADFYPANVAANDYVVAGTRYITYLLGNGAIDYCDCGVKTPNEVSRDPATNGGMDTLYTRQRKLFAPHGFSFVQPSTAIISPTNAQLETADRWTPVKDTAGTGYYESKAIPIARIISLG